MAGDVAEQVGLLRRGPAIPVAAQDAPIAKVVHIGVAAAGDESHRGQLDVVTRWRSPGVDGSPRIGFADSGAVAQGIEQGRPKARVVGSIPTSPSSPQRWTRVTPSCRMGHGDRGTTRRDVLRGGAALATVAVAGGLMDACVTAQPPPAPSASLGPPETTTLRVPLIPPCDPWYAYCEPFLRDVGVTGNIITPFTDGKVDAIFVAAAAGPVLMADPKNPGHVILDSSKDKPWSQNYCCVLVTSRDWYSAHPIAAKRMTRAILRATDAAKKDLRAAAKLTAEKQTYKATPAVTEQVLYDTIKDESFDWREYDPDDTVRFFALRLADAKLVTKTPQRILTDGADFAYFRQLRKELPRE